MYCFHLGLSAADFSESLHTGLRLRGFGFLTEEQGTHGVVNVCMPLEVILVFPKTPLAQPKSFRSLCLQQHSVRFYTGVYQLGGIYGTNVP